MVGTTTGVTATITATATAAAPIIASILNGGTLLSCDLSMMHNMLVDELQHSLLNIRQP